MIFLRFIQKALEGKDVGPNFDLNGLYFAIENVGGLEKAMSGDDWRNIYKMFEMGKSRKEINNNMNNQET